MLEVANAVAAHHKDRKLTDGYAARREAAMAAFAQASRREGVDVDVGGGEQ
jgi:hypothetical protein